MRFSLEWLEKYLDTTASVDELAETMVKLGIEVEAVENEADNFKNVVIGHVIKREQHSDADRLGVCTVDVGEAEPLQIVCGAPNVRDGLTVAVALVGAVLPDDFVIKPSKIRGVKSNGMICSVRELGLGNEHEGIMELTTDAKVGSDFSESQNLAGVVFDVSITPNRGDALSVYGIARDLAAAGIGTLRMFEMPEIGVEKPIISASIESDDCHYFSGISILNIKNQSSPQWLQKLLVDAGLRPINAVVDVTNYINIGLGQPLHTYDADKIKGNIYVANAKGGEKYLALDGKEYTLSEGDLGIFGDSGLIGLAGIMGGESTCVDENTTNIYLEAAWFDRSRIAKTGQALQLVSDARHRFERGIDPAMTPLAAKIAANLITEICGAGLPDVKLSNMQELGSNIKQVVTIDFDPIKVKTFGGLDIETSEITEILESLGFDVKANGTALAVTPPSFRTYMETAEDLVEEVLRMKGYDTVPTVLPPIPQKAILDAAPCLVADRATRRGLASLGYLETINYSFIAKNKAKIFAEGAELLILANPIDEETMSTMRPSLVPSLLDAAVNNLARSETIVELAEVGKTYTEASEVLMAAGLKVGKPARHWNSNNSAVDIFEAKADALAIMQTLGVPVDRIQVRTGALSYYHPGKSGVLSLGKNVFGYFGEIHPSVLKQFKIKQVIVVFELNLEAISSFGGGKKAKYITSNYQSVSRDLAFIVDEKTAAGDVMMALKGADKVLVKSVDLFDVYQGDNVPNGKKSLAFSLVLQANDRTLTDDEIKIVCDKAVVNATKRFGAELRAG